MAADDAILQSVSSGGALPTLRLYAWSLPCITLGYGQKSSDVDFERLAASGWQLVRRQTGGSAVLHVDELTYTVALPAGDDLARLDIIESYRQISRALVSGLLRLGLEAEATPNRSHQVPDGPVCFDSPSIYEITAGGRKLVGSAQARRKAGILQHGSLPLSGDLGQICDALAFADEAARERARTRVRTRAITLSEALGRDVEWREAADAITRGFAGTLDIQFIPAAYTDWEWEQTQHLAAQAYSNLDLRRRRVSG